MLEPIEKWTRAGLDEDGRDEERGGERHGDQGASETLEGDDVLEERTQDVVAEGFHDAEIDGHQFVDKVARWFGVERDHHAALKEPRGGERRLVGVH